MKIWTRRLRSCLLPQRSICIRAMFAVLRAVKTWRKRCGTSQAEAFISPQSRNSARRPDLSDRSNIICISDEAHRTQTGVGAKLKKTDKGVFTTYGFAKYLRDSFPNATYCGFTGTPIDETIAVFGRVVDSYTMKESSDDGITVRIAYERDWPVLSYRMNRPKKSRSTISSVLPKAPIRSRSRKANGP